MKGLVWNTSDWKQKMRLFWLKYYCNTAKEIGFCQLFSVWRYLKIKNWLQGKCWNSLNSLLWIGNDSLTRSYRFFVICQFSKSLQCNSLWRGSVALECAMNVDSIYHMSSPRKEDLVFISHLSQLFHTLVSQPCWGCCWPSICHENRHNLIAHLIQPSSSNEAKLKGERQKNVEKKHCFDKFLKLVFNF